MFYVKGNPFISNKNAVKYGYTTNDVKKGKLNAKISSKPIMIKYI